MLSLSYDFNLSRNLISERSFLAGPQKSSIILPILQIRLKSDSIFHVQTEKKYFETQYEKLPLIILQWNFTMQRLLNSLGKSLPKGIQTGPSTALTNVVFINCILILNQPSTLRETNKYIVFLIIVYEINQ